MTGEARPRFVPHRPARLTEVAACNPRRGA